MSFDYFIYLILYITVMVLIFTMSFIMLHPRSRALFNAPVPHIHNTIGKLMIPWGITYLVFLPDIYLSINGVQWRDHAYIVISLLTLLICLSVSPWSYMTCLQQGVKQHVVQPILLFLPTTITLWYAIAPAEWKLQAFCIVFLAEICILVCYYVVLYRAFVRDLKQNYSSIKTSMLHGLWAQWIASLLSVFTFLASISEDTAFWGIVNIFTNIFSLSVLVYTSEHLMPLPEKNEMDTEQEMPEERQTFDMTKLLHDNCEAHLLFCNPELSLQDLSIVVGTNRTYLSKWFADNDTTFYNYINKLRIDYAAQLLLTTDESIKTIQANAGFASKTTFRKDFLDYYGCSPSQYRSKESESVPES